MPEAEPQAAAEPLASSPFAEPLAPSPFVEPLRVPQFGIIHLMLWTAATAVLLKLYLALTGELNAQMPAGYYWMSRVSTALQAIVWASALVGSGVLIRLRFYTMLTRLQPGHWLVLIATLEFVVLLVTLSIYWLLKSVEGVGMTAWILIVQALMSSLVAAPAVLAFVKLRDTKRWKIFMGVKAVAAVATVALTVLFTINVFFRTSLYSPGGSSFLWMNAISVCMGICYVAVFIMFVVAVALDLWRRAARDWLHWLGVGIVGSSYVLSLIMLVFSLFVSRMGFLQ
jgi:hypothetical protein